MDVHQWADTHDASGGNIVVAPETNMKVAGPLSLLRVKSLAAFKPLYSPGRYE